MYSESLGDVENRMRAVLHTYERAHMGGDFLQALLAVHSTLEDAFNVHLAGTGESLSFNQKASKVLPQDVYVAARVEELNNQRNRLAHPMRHYTEDYIRETAVGLVTLALAAWPFVFQTPAPPVNHPSSETTPAATVAPVTQAAPVRAWHIAWVDLSLSILLLLVVPWLAGLTYYLWVYHPVAWYWPVALAFILLVSLYFLVRALWRFLSAFGLLRFLAVASVAFVAATLLLIPFAPRGTDLTNKASQAFSRVFNFVNVASIGVIPRLFDSGQSLASRYYSVRSQAQAPTNGPFAPPTAEPTATSISFPTATSATTTSSAQTPSPALSGTIAVGVAVVVKTDGARLLSRAGPGRSQPVVTRFDNGARLVVLEGPVEADGFTWWRVQGPGGTGWSASTYLTAATDGE